MSEPFVERLSGFTPDAGRLDRDALLFAAGRSSARSPRGWKTLALLLAGTQSLSLAMLWPHPIRPGGRSILPVAAVPVPRADLQPPITETPVSPGNWSARQSLLESERTARPTANLTLIDTGPPLRAFPPPPSLLN
jgi:hypothetical protein